jgi:hypothetical protein
MGTSSSSPTPAASTGATNVSGVEQQTGETPSTPRLVVRVLLLESKGADDVGKGRDKRRKAKLKTLNRTSQVRQVEGMPENIQFHVVNSGGHALQGREEAEPAAS